jgi:hypothetical protein
MPKNAPVQFQESRRHLLLVEVIGRTLMVVMWIAACSATRGLAADEGAVKILPPETPKPSVTIRLELRPSAPQAESPAESSTESPAVSDAPVTPPAPQEPAAKTPAKLVSAPTEKSASAPAGGGLELVPNQLRTGNSQRPAADGVAKSEPGKSSTSELNTKQPSGGLELTGPKRSLPTDADTLTPTLSDSRSSREQGPKSPTPPASQPAGGQPPLKSLELERSPSRLSPEKPPTKLPTQKSTTTTDGLSGTLELGGSSSDKPATSSARISDAPIDRDFSNERMETDQPSMAESALQPDDVPLEQEDHPYDAPSAESTKLPVPSRPAIPLIEPAQPSQLTARELRIKSDIQRCLEYYLTHPENTTRRGPWALMHAALPFGVESEVIAGNRRVNTLGWLAFNGTCGKQNMFQPTRQGFRPNVGPGVQGHEGQFLAILAQSRVPGDYPLQINGRKYSVMDLARYEMSTCREKSELTFKLIGLSFYLEPDQRWRDNRGQTWNLEKMVAEELAQPINGAACGGVHRLMGLSYSMIQRQEAGQPITGHWSRSKAYLNDYVNYALSLQNPDGSFSTNWFESRGMQSDVERKVQTTGHILEWLVYTIPDEHLRSNRIYLSLEFLLDSIGREPQRDWPIGPRSHALRAMSVYLQRLYGVQPGKIKDYLANAGRESTRR